MPDVLHSIIQDNIHSFAVCIAFVMFMQGDEKVRFPREFFTGSKEKGSASSKLSGENVSG